MSDREEVYVSCDVETDGQIPGPHSMLSVGLAAFKRNKELVSTFSANLLPLLGAAGNPDTLAWWKTQPAAWAELMKDRRDPAAVMADARKWFTSLPGSPVLVEYPGSWDFMFVFWYFHKFLGESPIAHSSIGVRAYVMGMNDCDYRDTTKRNMPKRWFDPSPHTHKALDDAIEQGRLFCNIVAENDKRHKR